MTNTFEYISFCMLLIMCSLEKKKQKTDRSYCTGPTAQVMYRSYYSGPNVDELNR